ncbi:MAG TPA: hypothetical protein VNT54_13680 [Solirubrobacteraceae bacterium]|nr:hypothetical protein [Solirubrobacteraceae bacterium]
MEPLTHNQQELLLRMVEADRQSIARRGEPDRFAWHRRGGMGPTVFMHAGLPGGQIEGVVVDDLEELIRKGLLEQTGQRAARLTDDGRRRAPELQASSAAAGTPDWNTVMEPLLRRVYELWAEGGLHPLGVQIEAIAAGWDGEPSVLQRLLDLLSAEGWLEQRSAGMISAGGPGPAYAPAGRALERLAGWPGAGMEAREVLVAALEAAEQESTDPEEKSKLRQLAASVRSISEQTAAGVLSHLATGGG